MTKLPERIQIGEDWYVREKSDQASTLNHQCTRSIHLTYEDDGIVLDAGLLADKYFVGRPGWTWLTIEGKGMYDRFPKEEWDSDTFMLSVIKSGKIPDGDSPFSTYFPEEYLDKLVAFLKEMKAAGWLRVPSNK